MSNNQITHVNRDAKNYQMLVEWPDGTIMHRASLYIQDELRGVCFYCEGDLESKAGDYEIVAYRYIEYDYAEYIHLVLHPNSIQKCPHCSEQINTLTIPAHFVLQSDLRKLD